MTTTAARPRSDEEEEEEEEGEAQEGEDGRPTDRVGIFKQMMDDNRCSK